MTSTPSSTPTPAQLFSDVLAAYLEDLSESQAVLLEQQSTVHQRHGSGAAQPNVSSFLAPSLSLARAKSRSSSTSTPTSCQAPLPSFPTAALSHLRRPPLPQARPIASMDYFCAEAEPPISYHKYLQRLLQYFRCSSECFVLLCAYLRRAVYEKAIFLSCKNVHRLCLVGLLLAVKQREDIYYSMKYYASVGGVQVRDLMDMELKFFADVLEYGGHVEEDEYRATLDAMSMSWHQRHQQPHHLLEGSHSFLTMAASNKSPAMRIVAPVPPSAVLPLTGMNLPAVQPFGKGMPSRIGSSGTSQCGLSGMSSPVSESLDLAAPPQWVVECGLFW